MSAFPHIQAVKRRRRMVPSLRIARVAADLTQAELAELAGVTRQTIGALEAGGSPRMNTAQALADALGVPVAELFPSGGSEQNA